MKMISFESLPRPTKTYHTTTYDRISKHHGFEGKGKTVLITGGATGIGFSMAKAFAEAGVARIALVSRCLSRQKEAKADLEAAYPCVQVLIHEADIADRKRMNNVLRELASVDVLVLCAAATHPPVRGTDLSTDIMQTMFDIQVIAAFEIVKAFLAMSPPTSGQKTVINVSSAACQMRSPLRIGYGPSKAAITQIMQHFAMEQETDHNNFFSIHPGAFYTRTVAGVVPESAMKWEDIDLPAHFALWLAGPQSRFLNGRFVWANWDVDELIELKPKIEANKSLLTIGLVH